MGPFRRGLILGLAWPTAATAAIADTCAVQRPDWDGTPVSAVQEALALASSPVVLVLMVATVAVFRFKSQWGAVALVVAWSAMVSLVTMLAPASRQSAMAEGCIGAPTLFIGIIAAICVAMILYTAPAEKQD